MKIEWLVADVTAVGSVDIAEHAISGVILAERVFWPIQAVFVVRVPLCNLGPPS